MESPSFAGVLETVLYHDGGVGEAVRRFYGEVLGLPPRRRLGDGVAFRVGAGVLLLSIASGSRSAPARSPTMARAARVMPACTPLPVSTSGGVSS